MDEDAILKYIPTIIKTFSTMCLNFNQRYYTDNSNDLNLKKTYVSQCEFDSEFNQTIFKYLNGISDFMLDSDELFAFQTVQYGKFRSRTKTMESVYAKIHHYAQREIFDGGAAINKCLNDLFGSRIILPSIREHLEQILNILYELRKDGCIWRYYVRDKGDGYFAIHCYFREDNYKFPWELQIWDCDDENSNMESHEAHENQKRDTI